MQKQWCLLIFFNVLFVCVCFRVDRCVAITAAGVWVVGYGLPFQLSSMVLRGMGTLHLLIWGVLMCFITPLLRCFTFLWRQLLKLPQAWAAPPSASGLPDRSPSEATCITPALSTPRRPPDLPHTPVPPWWWALKSLWGTLPCPVMCLRHLPRWGQLVIVTLQRLVLCQTIGTTDLYIKVPSHGYDLKKHNSSGSVKRGREKVSHELIKARNDKCLNQIPSSIPPT